MPIQFRDPNNPDVVTLKFTQEEQELTVGFVPPDETPIIKYMSLNKFYSILTSSSLRFTRLDQFSDEYEGLAVIQTPPSEAALYFRKLSLASCWNHFATESFPLWKIYLDNQPGVAIISTVGQFMSGLNEKDRKHVTPYFVKYVEPNANYVSINNMILATRKKSFYAYEKEIRFNFYTGGGKSFEQPEGMSIEISPHDVIQSVITSPYMPSWVRSSFDSILSSLGYGQLTIVESQVRDRLIR